MRVQLTRSSSTPYILSLVALCVGLTGCSTQQPGNPTAGTTTSTSATTSENPSPTTSTGAGGSLAQFDSCAVLTGVAGPLGLTAIEEDGAQECKSRYATTVSVRVKAFPSLGLKDVTGGPNAEFSDVTVGAHKAKLVKKALSSSACAVALEVGPTSRVDVVASANASLDEACAAANAVATAIEPKLPK
ncbi:MAG TPA: DUF3558 family protein [Umezawaea sp.]|nr:DUF3558 family protein [Umezawaea sp.]